MKHETQTEAKRLPFTSSHIHPATSQPKVPNLVCVCVYIWSFTEHEEQIFRLYSLAIGSFTLHYVGVAETHTPLINIHYCSA